MRHTAKTDWWIVLAALVGVLAPLPSHSYWASGIVLGVLFLGVYPQSYESTPRGLQVRAGLTRRLVPYEVITFVGPAPARGASAAWSRDRVKVAWGLASEVVISPADRAAFFADIAVRAPHLCQRGPDLVAVAV